MKKRIQIMTLLVLLLTAVLLFSACAGVTAGEGTTPDPDDDKAYPDPSDDEPIPVEPDGGIGDSAYPEPGGEIGRGETLYPSPIDPIRRRDFGEIPPQFHKFAPQPGDERMMRGNSYIETIVLDVLEGTPAEVNLNLIGNLPTPCHEIRVIVHEPLDDGTIPVTVYTVQDPDTMCIQVLDPFEISVSLGEYIEGDYRVALNGVVVSEFSIP